VTPVVDTAIAHEARGLRARVVRDLFERPPGNFQGLDGLRGFASVIVHVYHCGLWTGQFGTDNPIRRALNGFWTGIDIFFVLSGFLIGRILVGELVRDGWIHYAKFLVRRSFRIFPAYYLVLGTLLLAVGAVTLPPLSYYLFGTTDAAVLRAIGWSNFVYLNNYAQPVHGAIVMSWAWSLCIEEHFYLLLPPVLWAIFRFAPGRLRLALLVGCVLVQFAGRMAQFAANPALVLLDGFYYRSHNRFDEIFVGVVIAYLHVVHGGALEATARRLRHVLWPLGFALAATVWIGGGLLATGGFAVVWQFLVMAVATGLVLVNNLYLRNRVARFFAHPFWYPLSRVSYGSYLVHPFVIFGLLALGLRLGVRPAGVPGFAVFSFAVLAVATLLASILFIFVERPLLDYGVQLAKRVDAKAITRRSQGLRST
jgi:peptidoglycan/LPS O-acetylase OafA/YrhL